MLPVGLSWKACGAGAGPQGSMNALFIDGTLGKRKFGTCDQSPSRMLVPVPPRCARASYAWICTSIGVMPAVSARRSAACAPAICRAASASARASMIFVVAEASAFS